VPKPIPEVDFEALEDQKKYLAWLRRQNLGKLKRHHKTIFPRGHRFYMSLPKWCPRYYYERRLFFWFMAQNYHLPDPYRREFRKKAIQVLDYRPKDETRPKDIAIYKELADLRLFTPRGIANLTEDRVDFYLTRLGYLVDVPLDQKKQILFELYHLHQSDIVPRFSLKTGKPVTYQVRNAETIRKAILESPDLPFPEFKARYKYRLPPINRRSWQRARSILRSAGADIPDLRGKGRVQKAAIVSKGRLTPAAEAIIEEGRNKGSGDEED
jgi:hypothetical protein